MTMTPEAAQALMTLTSLTPDFLDQKISFVGEGQEGDTNHYYSVQALRGDTNVVFVVNIGVGKDHLADTTIWNTLMEAVAKEFNRIQVTPQ